MNKPKDNLKINHSSAVKGRIGILGLAASKSMLKVNNLNKLKSKGLTEKEAEELLKTVSYHQICYEQFLKIQGLEVVHLNYHSEKGEIACAMDSIDGVLLTGGGYFWPHESTTINSLEYFKVITPRNEPYLDYIKEIMDKAKSINDNGRHFPIFAICLGFEGILLAESDFAYPIAHVKHWDCNRKIKLKEGDSKLKCVLTDNQIKNMTTKDLLYFYHSLGFTEAMFHDYKSLTDNYDITATVSIGDYGSCIASFEHKKYPFFGTQYHPEKNMFDYGTDFNPNHSDEAYQLGLSLSKLCIPKSVLNTKKDIQSDLYQSIVNIKERKTTIIAVSKDPRVKLLNGD